jgi:hypothetical protein
MLMRSNTPEGRAGCLKDGRSRGSPSSNGNTEFTGGTAEVVLVIVSEISGIRGVDGLSSLTIPIGADDVKSVFPGPLEVPNDNSGKGKEPEASGTEARGEVALLLLAGSPDGDDPVAFRLPNRLRRALAMEPSFIGLTVVAVAGVLFWGEVDNMLLLAVGRVIVLALVALACGARAGVDCEAAERDVEAVVTVGTGGGLFAA